MRCHFFEKSSAPKEINRDAMAIGQTRTIGEGLASAWAAIMKNPLQFLLAALLVMACGATKKVSPALPARAR